ncbi:MAG TPA: hypothetical protein PKY81_05755 [bacterium]|nr:hypothetical protein [bacterium]HPN30443.1 hypothetical protein [bacterium]
MSAISFCCEASGKSNPEIILVSDRSSALIGDTIELSLTVKYSENITGVRIRNEAIGSEIFEVYEIEKEESAAGFETYRIIVSPFHISETETVIPGIPVEYRENNGDELKTAYSNEIPIKLEDIKLDSKKWMLDMEKPVLKKYDYSGIIMIIVICASLFCLFGVVYAKLKKHLFIKLADDSDKKSRQFDAAQFIETILIKLESMKNNPQADFGGIKISAFEISLILRTALEKIFKIECLEASNLELKKKFENISFSKKYLYFETLDILEKIKFSVDSNFDSGIMNSILDDCVESLGSLKNEISSFVIEQEKK